MAKGKSGGVSAPEKTGAVPSGSAGPKGKEKGKAKADLTSDDEGFFDVVEGGQLQKELTAAVGSKSMAKIKEVQAASKASGSTDRNWKTRKNARQ